MDPEDIIRHFLLNEQELAAIIDLVPHRPNTLQSLNLTTQRNVSTTEIRIAKREGRLALVPTTERGAPIPQAMPEGATHRTFPTYRIAKGSTIFADELQDVIRLGSGRVLARVAEELARRYQALETDIALTEENMQLGMVQGRIPDADGTVLIDYFDEFGVVPGTPVPWAFATASLAELRQQGNDLYRSIGRALAGMPWGGRIGALMGDGAYDALVTSPAVESTYLQHAGARDLDTVGRAFESFPFAGIEWINYRGTDDRSTVAVPDGEIVFFPIGADGMFMDVRGPGEDLDDVNRVGRRRFPVVVRDHERNRFVKPELYTYPQFVVTAPQALRRGTV